MISAGSLREIVDFKMSHFWRIKKTLMFVCPYGQHEATFIKIGPKFACPQELQNQSNCFQNELFSTTVLFYNGNFLIRIKFCFKAIKKRLKKLSLKLIYSSRPNSSIDLYLKRRKLQSVPMAENHKLTFYTRANNYFH